MNSSVASNANAPDVAHDIDNYDWSHTFKPVREENVPTPQPTETPKTPNEPRFKQPMQVAESFDEIDMRLSNEFAPVIEKGADTLVYIGVPPPTPSQDPHVYDYTQRLFARPYLMRSTTLRSVESSKFDKLLGPSSARTARKLKKLDLHKSVMQPDTIKYYVDLSPILNDDEALIQITELTVPHSALKWHQLAKNLGIPVSHVGGRDELNVPPKRTYPPLVQEKLSNDADKDDDQSKKGAWQDDAISKNGKKLKSRKSGGGTPRASSKDSTPALELPLEDEYSSLRHHTATARLLQALAGNNPKINSAAKAWTFCMLAKYFDCAHHPLVSHWIVSWLLENGNSHFIQNNPEVAYRMAIATQSTWLIRCTFAILVGLQAMIESTNDLLLGDSEQPKYRRGCHAISCLDDDDINRIDHAATALARRVRDTLEEIAVFPGIWDIEASPSKEMAKLNRLRFDNVEQQCLLQSVKEQMKDYARRIIYMTLSPSYDVQGVKSIGPFNGLSSFPIYTHVPQPLRLLTQHFWNILRLEQFTRDYTDTAENHKIWTQTQALLQKYGIITDAEIPYVSRTKLFATLDRLNQFLVSPAGRSKHEPVVHGRSNTPEISTPAKKVKLSPDTTRHGRSSSTEMEPLLQKLNDSSIESDLVSQQPKSPFADILKGAAKVVNEDDDWEDTMEDLYPLGGPPLRSLPVRGKLMADAPQVMMPISPPTPFGTDNKLHYVRPYPANAPVSACGQPDRSLHPFLPTRTIGVLPEAQRWPNQNTFGTPETRPPYPASTGSSKLSHNIVNDQIVSQRNVSALYDGPSSDSSDDAISPATTAKHQRILLPDDSPFLDSLVDEAPPDCEFDASRFDHRVASSKALADNKDEKLEMRSWIGKQVQFDDFAQAAPPPSLSSPQLSPQQTQSNNRTWAPTDPNPRPITPTALLEEISRNIYNRLSSIVTPGYVLDGTCDFDIPNGEISTLLCLNDNEWKYLPLWAGGLDDGTGGVFNDGVEVPDAPDIEDGGFRGGAMGIIPGVGSSIGGSMDGDGSEFEEIMTDIGVSTVGKASRIATNGTATETVISMDE